MTRGLGVIRALSVVFEVIIEHRRAVALERRVISSAWTLIYRFLFPTAWIGALCSALWRLGTPDGWSVVPILIFGFIWYVVAGRLLVVLVDDRFLYVSNYGKEVQIPLSDVSRVTQNLFINIHPVTIHLSKRIDFGTRIRFVPKGFYYGSHPVVAELNELVAQAKARNYREPHQR